LVKLGKVGAEVVLGVEAGALERRAGALETVEEFGREASEIIH